MLNDLEELQKKYYNCSAGFPGYLVSIMDIPVNVLYVKKMASFVCVLLCRNN